MLATRPVRSSLDLPLPLPAGSADGIGRHQTPGPRWRPWRRDGSGLSSSAATEFRGVEFVGARGFEPSTFRSRNGRRSVAAGANRSQVSERIANRGGREVQPSQLSTGVSKDFTTRLLPKIGIAFAPGTAPKVATTPTTADLVVLHGGRDPLLRVADVAERLGVCAATVYRLCERGELPHVRIVNSIRIRRADLDAFACAHTSATPKSDRQRPSAE